MYRPPRPTMVHPAADPYNSRRPLIGRSPNRHFSSAPSRDGKVCDNTLYHLFFLLPFPSQSHSIFCFIPKSSAGTAPIDHCSTCGLEISKSADNVSFSQWKNHPRGMRRCKTCIHPVSSSTVVTDLSSSTASSLSMPSSVNSDVPSTAHRGPDMKSGMQRGMQQRRWNMQRTCQTEECHIDLLYKNQIFCGRYTIHRA